MLSLMIQAGYDGSNHCRKTLQNPLTRIIARYLLADYCSLPACGLLLSTCSLATCDVVLPTLYRNLNQLEMCEVNCDFVFENKLTSLRFPSKQQKFPLSTNLSCDNCHEMFNCNLLYIVLTKKIYACHRPTCMSL